MKRIFLYQLSAIFYAPLFVLAASDNTIHFTGEVTSQTCSVTVNGSAASPMVLLPTVPTASLAKSGDTAGLTKFTIGLTGCTDPATADQSVGTIFMANNLTSNNRIGNIGTATNVSLQLVDPQTPATALDMTGATPAPGLIIAKGTTSASHDFAVEYYAEGISTAGSVLGSVQYAVSYQ